MALEYTTISSLSLLMSVMRPEMIMKSIIPVVMAGIIAIYGLVVAVLIANSLNDGISLYRSFLQLGAGLSVGLSGLAAGFGKDRWEPTAAGIGRTGRSELPFLGLCVTPIHPAVYLGQSYRAGLQHTWVSQRALPGPKVLQRSPTPDQESLRGWPDNQHRDKDCPSLVESLL